jgi:hypothetical protein
MKRMRQATCSEASGKTCGDRRAHASCACTATCTAGRAVRVRRDVSRTAQPARSSCRTQHQGGNMHAPDASLGRIPGDGEAVSSTTIPASVLSLLRRPEFPRSPGTTRPGCCRTRWARTRSGSPNGCARCCRCGRACGSSTWAAAARHDQHLPGPRVRRAGLGADLWITPDHNFGGLRSGRADVVFPIRAEAHALPFAAASSTSSSPSMPGSTSAPTHSTSTTSARFVAPGGSIGVVCVGLAQPH